MKYFFKGNHLTCHQFYCFNCIIKNLFVKMKNCTVKINTWWSNQYTEAQMFRCSVVQMFLKIGILHNFSNSGDNTEKIWAHQFLAKPKTIEAGGLGGALSPQGVQANALVNACMQILEQFCFFFLIQHAKMV